MTPTIPDYPLDARPNPPVAAADGTLYVLPDSEGGTCVCRTARGDRCRKIAWPYGQTARPAIHEFDDGRFLRYVQPDFDDVVTQLLEQRCPMHRKRSTPGTFTPEWEYFDEQRHSDWIEHPHLGDLADNPPDTVPTIATLHRMIRAEYSRADQKHLSALLNTEENQP